MFMKQCYVLGYWLRSLRINNKAHPSNHFPWLLWQVGCYIDGNRAEVRGFYKRFCNLEKGLAYRKFLRNLTPLSKEYIILSPFPRWQQVLWAMTSRIPVNQNSFFFFFCKYLTLASSQISQFFKWCHKTTIDCWNYSTKPFKRYTSNI